MTFNLQSALQAIDAVILANGDFPKNSIPLGVLRSAKYLCCCDDAARSCIENGFTPDAIVGDGDSLSLEFKERYTDILHIVREQENNDLTKATRFCMEQGFKNIAYLGATGMREDHTLGNISLLVRYMEDYHLSPVMLTDYGYFIPINGTCKIDTFTRQQVSIFNFTCNEIKSSGLRWNTYPYHSWWQGTLNEATSSRVTFETDGCMITFFTYESK